MGERLQAHLEETAATYDLQLAASKNAEQLASALGSLTSTAQAELQQINNTARSIQEDLRASQGHGARIWYSILLSAFKVIGRGISHRSHSLRSLIRWPEGNLPGYQQLSENTIFRVAIIVGQLAWNTTWFLLSAMMVMISYEIICVLTPLPERIVPTVEVFVSQVKETVRKCKIIASLRRRNYLLCCPPRDSQSFSYRTLKPSLLP